MSTWINEGGPDREISSRETETYLKGVAEAMPAGLKKVLLIPPDFSRFHSGAGEICSQLYLSLAKRATVELLPALGTHRPMTAAEITQMFPGVPHDLIRIHDWQQGLTPMGAIPGERLKELSGGKVDYTVNIEIDQLIALGKHEAIISCGQVVPHEVIGMAGGNKNILVGCAGPDTINKSHFLGAVCNMESIMGRIESPVRTLLNEAQDCLLAHLPITYVLTVRAKNAKGRLITRGLYAGNDRDSFQRAARLSQQVNIVKTPRLEKVVVYLDPGEFKSTWLGNKAIYRTRMALADNGELLILAPGLVEFGEAEINERMIRRYGYHGTPATLRAVAADPELRNSLGAAAHLIHGSSEGRFTITYAPGGLSRAEIEGVGFRHADLKSALARYNPAKLKDGFNILPDGEEIYYISNPALGLWQAEA
ncbi:MAG: lactate racemase domain-containing protein [Kiritimatiellae bacterium]|nr:lactate racemase domain-containing protein [Kiritimatiellia bacterium]